MKKKFIQALEAGYGGGKGLVRNVNIHGGGFHMVGKRRSSQSSGLQYVDLAIQFTMTTTHRYITQ